MVLPAKELPLFSVPAEVGPVQAFVKRPLPDDGQVQIHGNLKLPQFRSYSFSYQNFFNLVFLHIKTVSLLSYIYKLSKQSKYYFYRLCLSLNYKSLMLIYCILYKNFNNWILIFDTKNCRN